MLREWRGPYGDPQHPYFYEEDDVWMAPGFINQFYDVSQILDSAFSLSSSNIVINFHWVLIFLDRFQIIGRLMFKT